jgi:type 2 lantibiotic biosynthesis protein LanM
MRAPFPEIWRAFNLEERAAALRRMPRPLPPLDDRQRTLAEKRLARWRSQPPFDRHEVFARRLAAAGLTEDEMLWLLGAPAESLAPYLPTPAWLTAVDAALERQDGPPVRWPEEAVRAPTGGFLRIAEPFVQGALERLHAGVTEIAAGGDPLPFDPESVDRLLLADLPLTLLPMLSRVMVLELHAAELEERVEGETPEARLDELMRELEMPAARLTLWSDYPVLARLLAEAMERWAESGLELLQHLVAGWEMIRAIFSPGREPGLLERLDTRAGDPHRQGRTVAILHYSSGLNLVYKPKVLAVDRHVQELLVWLNEQGLEPPLRTLAILDRGTHGWVEHVEARPAGSPAALQRFYRRQGSLLALLFALEATDFHYQNLIADGEHPVPVDLEALFHARLDGPINREVPDAERQAARGLAFSVLRVGLLPRRRWYAVDGGEEALDESGLAAAGEPLAMLPVPIPEAAGGAGLRIVRRRLPMDRGRHLPDNGGDSGAASLLAHGDELMQGFRDTYRLLTRLRPELLAPDGPLSRFAEDEVRLILRSTRVYDAPLAESFHPELLGDALLRDRLFDRLWIETDVRPHLERVLPAEIRALWRGDIPLFTAHPGGREVRTDEGCRLDGFLHESGLELVRERLASFCESDLEQQLYFIRAALASLAPTDNGGERGSRQLAAAGEMPGRDEILDAAVAIGCRLDALAIRGGSGVTWVGLHTGLDGTLFLDPLPAPLHYGLGGIAVFLSHLAAATGDAGFEHLARGAWSTAGEQLRQDRAALRPIGGFLGWGSLIVTLLHLGALWKEEALLDEAAGLVAEIAARLDEDRDLDILGGTAGALAALLRLHVERPAAGALDLARCCGERLLELARPMDGESLRGIAWWSRGSQALPLTGFSHGVAGIGWALLELAAATGDSRFRRAALDAFEYERSTFQPRLGNWPDLRYYDLEGWPLAGQELPEIFPAWCHGAAGIALSRVAALRHADLPELRDDLRQAVRVVLERGFGHNQSLCHGDLGNLDILLAAARFLDDGELARQGGRIAGSVLAGAQRDGWRCGISYGAETPGLMAGLAGIGYGLLRLAAPETVPSLLLLETPARPTPPSAP